MDNITTFLKWAAGIVITLAIIAIAFIVFNNAKNGTAKSMEKMNEINNQVAESDITIYDNMVVSGSDVYTAVKKFKNDYLAIQVTTGKSSTWYNQAGAVSAAGVGSITGASASVVSNMLLESNNQYVNPNGQFLGTVSRDVNGSAVVLVFTQQ